MIRGPTGGRRAEPPRQPARPYAKPVPGYDRDRRLFRKDGWVRSGQGGPHARRMVRQEAARVRRALNGGASATLAALRTPLQYAHRAAGENTREISRLETWTSTPVLAVGHTAREDDSTVPNRATRRERRLFPCGSKRSVDPPGSAGIAPRLLVGSRSIAWYSIASCCSTPAKIRV